MAEGIAEIYFLSDRYGAGKIGITQAGRSRLSRHQRQGWDLVARWSVSSREQARKVEREVLEWVRTDCDSPPAYGPTSCPDGWTETINLSKVGIANVLEQIRVRLEKL